MRREADQYRGWLLFKKYWPASIMFLLWFLTVPLRAEDASSLTYSQVVVEVSKNPGSSFISVQGKIRYDVRQLTYDHAVKSVCFYLPFNDHRHWRGTFIESFLDRTDVRVTGSKAQSTQTRITSRDERPQVSYIHEVLLKPTQDFVELEFVSQIPALLTRQIPIDGFYPHLLTRCPSSSGHSDDLLDRALMNLDVSVTNQLANFDLILPQIGVVSKGQVGSLSLVTKQFHFYAQKDYKIQHVTMGDYDVTFVYYAHELEEILASIRHALLYLSHQFGELDTKRLVIIETQKDRDMVNPGLLNLSTARQESFQTLQSKLLNWSHWVAIRVVARQWFGAQVTSHEDDGWLLRGMVEYATLKVLEDYEVRAELFRWSQKKDPLFQINFREVIDLISAFMARDVPKMRLISSDQKTALPLKLQHAFMHLRLTQALRQFEWQMGEKRFFRVVRALFHDVRYANLTPQVFLKLFEKYVFQEDPRGSDLIFLNKEIWFEGYEWPDVSLVHVDAHKVNNNQWHIDVQLEKQTPFYLPLEVGIYSRNNEQVQFVQITAENWKDFSFLKTSWLIDFEPSYVVIDPKHRFFDRNRFDNRSDSWSVQLFPGNARRIADDQLTAFWAVYPFRRPAQNWSLALHGVLLKYVDPIFILALETEVQGEFRQLVRVKHKRRVTDFLLDLIFKVEQNIYGNRTASVSFSKKVEWSQLEIQLAIEPSYRAVAGQTKTDHYAIATKMTLFPQDIASRLCGYRLDMAYESAPPSVVSNFSYDKRWAAFLGFCHLGLGIDLSIRGFRGELTFTGDLSDKFYFRSEDAEGARLRLDLSGVNPVTKIYSVNNDLFLPLGFSDLSKAYIIGRRLKARLYYDYGYALDEHKDFRAAGAGLFMPFGGDLSGVGTLALTQASFLVVLYSKYSSQVSRKPRYLLNFGGEF